jgi:hypothetical protein
MLTINRAAVAALGVAGLITLPLSGCGGSSDEAAVAKDDQPCSVQPIKGTDRSLVTLSALAAKRDGVRTGAIRVKRIGGERREVLPYSALVYDAEGNTFTYTSPKPLQFVRRAVTVESIKGGDAILSKGPPSGTQVVTVGSQEIYGVEYEVEED